MRSISFVLSAILVGATYATTEPAQNQGASIIATLSETTPTPRTRTATTLTATAASHIRTTATAREASQAAQPSGQGGRHGGGGGERGKGGGKGGGKAPPPAPNTPAECKEIAMLSALVQVANNETRLASASHNNATRAEEIKASASSAAPRLQSLESNGTLVMTCQQSDAVEDDTARCKQMRDLQRLQRLASNSTQLGQATKNNQTKAGQIESAAAKEKPALDALQSNATLTQFCSVQDTNNQCRMITSIEKEMVLVQNETALDAQFHGNQSRIEEFKNKAARDSSILARLTNNVTLTDYCRQQNGSASSAVSATTQRPTPSTTSSPQASSTKQGGAVAVQPAIGSMIALVALLVVNVLFL